MKRFVEGEDRGQGSLLPELLKEIEVRLEATGETQISLTDPDACSMMTRGSGIVGYNVQTAVDTKHHLIVEHEVSAATAINCRRAQKARA